MLDFGHNHSRMMTWKMRKPARLNDTGNKMMSALLEQVNVTMRREVRDYHAVCVEQRS